MIPFYLTSWAAAIGTSLVVVFVLGTILYKHKEDKAWLKNIVTTVTKLLGTMALSALIIYGAVVCYWLIYPYNVIDVESITIQNPGKVVKQGGVLMYEIKYKKFMDIVGTVHRQLVNTYTITYSDAIGMSPIGERSTTTHLPVPLYASPGKYHLLWRVTHPVNPMRSVTESVWSDEFEIIPDGVDPQKGDKGDRGPQGKQGEQGEEGKTGPPGKKGSGFWPSSSRDGRKTIPPDNQLMQYPGG
jgi:hypothetical protein